MDVLRHFRDSHVNAVPLLISKSCNSDWCTAPPKNNWVFFPSSTGLSPLLQTDMVLVLISSHFLDVEGKLSAVSREGSSIVKCHAMEKLHITMPSSTVGTCTTKASFSFSINEHILIFLISIMEIQYTCVVGSLKTLNREKWSDLCNSSTKGNNTWESQGEGRVMLPFK